MPILISAIALLGLAVGSFLNVVVHRVPRGESLVRPGSHCPECRHAIRARHNVPVLGWLALRGRCADCAAPISVRYPLVELATAVLFVAVTARIADLGMLPALPAYLFFTAVGIALTAIDLDVRRLPNAIVLPSYAVLAVLLGGAAVISGDVEALLQAAVGAAAMFTGYLVLALAHRNGIGFGDVKFAGVVGAVLGFLGFPALLVGAFAAFLLGGVAGALLMLGGRAGRKSAIPFGPAMTAGALLALFAGAPLADAYLRLAHQA